MEFEWSGDASDLSAAKSDEIIWKAQLFLWMANNTPKQALMKLIHLGNKTNTSQLKLSVLVEDLTPSCCTSKETAGFGRLCPQNLSMESHSSLCLWTHTMPWGKLLPSASGLNNPCMEVHREKQGEFQLVIINHRAQTVWRSNQSLCPSHKEVYSTRGVYYYCWPKIIKVILFRLEQ